MSEGFIYILFNPAFRHLVKIGKTRRLPEDRAAELSSTGVPHSYVVVYARIVCDCDTAEQEIHEFLDEYREKEDREFFRMTVEAAIAKVAFVCSQFPPNEDAAHKPDDDPDELEQKCSVRFTPIRSADDSKRQMPTATQPPRETRPWTDEEWERYRRQSERKKATTSQIKATEYVYIRCLKCSAEYSVTLHRLELGTTCPACHHRQNASVDW